MKNVIKINAIILVFSFLISCGGGASTADSEVTTTESVNTIQNGYLAIKDALVASDNNAVSKESASLAKRLKERINSSDEEAIKMLNSMSSEAEIKSQRESFLILSKLMYPELKESNSKLYLQFCPMANQGKGGYWISKDEEINNPYYGDAMLHCGVIKSEIK